MLLGKSKVNQTINQSKAKISNVSEYIYGSILWDKFMPYQKDAPKGLSMFSLMNYRETLEPIYLNGLSEMHEMCTMSEMFVLWWLGKQS